MESAFDDMFEIMASTTSLTHGLASTHGYDSDDDSANDSAEIDTADDFGDPEARMGVTAVGLPEGYSVDPMLSVLNKILGLVPEGLNVPIRRLPEQTQFNPAHNFLDPDVREQFKNESVFCETDIFTNPTLTTATIEGFISNVQFHERELIKELCPDNRVVIYHCNYGRIRYPGYTEPTKIRTTNRGRKKKQKQEKPRKKQGDGTDFNSQITFVTRKPADDAPCDEIITTNTEVHKFKVFRPGNLQLPGVHQHTIDRVIDCAEYIVEILNMHLHLDEPQDSPKLSKLIHINPVMKNYKFVVKMPPTHIIDMMSLATILRNDRAEQRRSETSQLNDYPRIFAIKYTRQDTKLSVKFNTPIFGKPGKCTRVNLFMLGKVNILGAFEAEVTEQICEYIHSRFEQYRDILIVSLVAAPRARIWQKNIESISDEEAMQIIARHQNWLPELPYISDEEYHSILADLESVYENIRDSANAYCDELLGSDWVW